MTFASWDQIRYVKSYKSATVTESFYSFNVTNYSIIERYPKIISTVNDLVFPEENPTKKDP